MFESVSNTLSLKDSITAGTEFLSTRQRPSGHFVAERLDISDNAGNSEETISTFVTSCLIYCLQWISNGRAESIRQKALDGIQAEIRLRGLYRYFANEQSYTPAGMGGKLPMTAVPDCDTTSCASYILNRYGREIDSRTALLARQNPLGLFPSWACEPADDLDDTFPFLILVPTSNDPCIGVNANVLMYFGDGPETRAVSDYICALYQEARPALHAQWYEEAFVHYMCSRAFFEGAVSLMPIREPMLECLYSRQQADGAFGTVIETAAAACTLMNFNATGLALDTAIGFLRASQRADGSWPNGTFYIGDERTAGVEMRFRGVRRMFLPPYTGDHPVLCYFGSEAITTAYCLEALSRFAEIR